MGVDAQAADHDGWSLDRHVMVLGADSTACTSGCRPRA